MFIHFYIFSARIKFGIHFIYPEYLFIDEIDVSEVALLSDAEKVNFTLNRLLTDIPRNFISKSQTKAKHCKQIFYDKKNDIREWIYFANNIFYCLYCLCFGNNNNVDEFSSSGIDYGKTNSRLSQKLQRHGESKGHIYNEKCFLKLCSKDHPASIVIKTDYNNEFRNAIRCFIKVIIYLTTHGK